jgi:hypothetical protein
MKLFLENDSGSRIEVKEIESLDKESDMLLLTMNVRMRTTDIESIEKYMSAKTGKKCIILDSMFDKVLSI